MDRQESLSKASKELMFKESFYGLFLIMMNKVWKKDVPTLGVSKNGINYQLSINEKFWNSLEPMHKLGILKHECLHIGFFHLENRSEFPDHKLANIATDMEINQYIDEEWLPSGTQSKEEFDEQWQPVIQKIQNDFDAGILTKEQAEDEMLKVPARGVYIKDFESYGLELKAGCRYYYEKLKEAQDKKDQEGTCGNKNLDELLEGDGPDHSTWKEFDNMDEAEKKLLHNQTEYILKEIAEQVTKSRGTIPGEFVQILEKINYKEPPKFDWKGYLRRFVGGSTKTYTKKKRSKFNKRFEDMPGLKIKMQKHVLVAVDTSGSVCKKSLGDFFKEIHHISKNNTEITIIQCDAAIRDIRPYKKSEADKIQIFGRGGTNFEPIIEYANSNTHKYTALIIMTDGCAPAPEKCRLKTLWVHDETSEINENLIGLKIKLN